MEFVKEMNGIQTELEKARAELLDVGLRNNSLINCQLSKARGVEIVDRQAADVYQGLVQDGKAMSFLPKPELGRQLRLGEGIDMEANFSQNTGIQLPTPYTSTEFQKRLSNTYRDSNTAIQELGVNTLYLALGMLQWYESASSDIRRNAPLILIPVELKRASIRARFRIHYTGEDIGTNLSLQEKLREFNIKFPSISEEDDADEIDIESYFLDVENAIRSKSYTWKWEVDTTAIVVGFFTFTKYLMYRDLDSANWPEDAAPWTHPVLKSILDEEGFQVSIGSFSDSAQIDQHFKPSDFHHVVDADSSQVLAIHDVCQGRNLVIQGPPGTGKSQTITNLIAEAMGTGKRVLFVAEKMAALEVVKRNLDSVGLGNACLELHSHKMNKKTVADELKRTLELDSPQLKSEYDLARLLNNRDRLNCYCEAVNSPISENGVTPFQAYGELLAVRRRLAGLEPPSLDIYQFQQSKSQFEKGLERIEELEQLLRRMGVPKNHPFWGSQCKHFVPNDEAEVKLSTVKAQETVTDLRRSSAELAQHLNLPSPYTPVVVESLIHVANRALDAPDLSDTVVQSTEWTEQSSDLEAGLNAGARLSQLHKEYDKILIHEAWKQEVLEIRKVVAVYGAKRWRIFSGKYRRARNELAGLCSAQLPKAQDSQLRILDAILEAQRELPHREKITDFGQRLFNTRWQGEYSNWSQLQKIAQYLSSIHESVEKNMLPEEIVQYLASKPDLKALQALVSQVEEHQKQHSEAIEKIIKKIEFDETVRFGEGGRLKERTFTEQKYIFDRWEGELNTLHDIVTYNHGAEAISQSGFAEIVKVAEAWPKAGQFLSDILKLAWYAAQVKMAVQERPVLAGFDSNIHLRIVDRFRQLDCLSLECNKAKVAYEHWTRLPQNQSSSGQFGVLKKEFAKERRHLPIRQLMGKAGNAIQAIKPIFMMSPLSVAKFLPPKSVDFDWVVFDEASQVEPVDAFGAVIRGEQTVVVGDDKQLPPTSFFQKIAANDNVDEEEESLAGNIKSILDLFCAQNVSQRMLRWHYRSRHESLITVSNREFYDNKLQLFPSPDAAKEEVGLIFHHRPDTVYDRGVSRKNQDEANIVAKRVMEHARSHSNLTLGVATFSMSQREAIQDALEILRREDPSCEHTFFDANPQEPFFVKNLENVQGDERDIIFISVGYGRDANGALTMNFGPLNQDGGERRLNVLITRARWRCEVFTNLNADDINISSTSPRGVVAFQRYLKYAQTGKLDIPELDADRQADSPFEEEVADALRELGFQVDYQIGSAGYFIDLGIKDPEHPGRYLLGIECDGATYHSAQSARDRDRLRQQVLEGLGWRIHRIWSTDWFKNPDRELRKVVEAFEVAKTHGPPVPVRPPKTNLKLDVIASSSLERRENSIAEKYELSELDIIYGSDLHTVPPSVMADWIQRVVEVESPVHSDEAARRVTKAAGVNRIGNRIRHALETAARRSDRLGKIRIKGRFFYWAQQQCVTVRDRGALPPSSRKLEFIAPEEIELAVKAVVSDSLGIERDDLPREVSRLFGFKSLSEDMRHTIELVVDRMIEQGELTARSNSLVLAKLDD